jgi:hypothetical protein
VERRLHCTRSVRRASGLLETRMDTPITWLACHIAEALVANS